MDDFNAAKGSEEYARLKALLANKAWRLDNLYTIVDENGVKRRFVRNEPQRAFCERMWSRDLILKARQLGFSTLLEILFLDACIFRSNTSAAIIDTTLTNAAKKLSMVKLAYEEMPDRIRLARPLVKSNTEVMEWDNGSSLSVGTSYRGGTLQLLHVSEYGKISVNSPDVAREIKTGSLRAVHASGYAAVESTAHGTAGEFYDMVKLAKHRQQTGVPATAIDFRLHFYAWHQKPEYVLPSNLVVITQDLKEYFLELQAKHGIKLSANQMAWYAKQYEDLGPDDVKQEFPSTPDEAFFNSVQGAYWQKEMTKARLEGRIGQALPHDPSRPVNTTWDIGEDGTVVLFTQTDGVRNRLIDYYEEVDGSLQSAALACHQKRAERGFVYAKHYGPHDIENKEWGNKAVSRKQTAKGLGIDFTTVPRIQYKAESIEAARRYLGNLWIDQEHCGRCVDAFDNYRRKWNDKMAVFLPDPVHDWTSHFADALQQIAMGQVADREKRDRGPRPKPQGTSWGA